MTDFRALCAELLSEFDYYSDWSDAEEVKERARVALAEPEPEGPTDEELRELWNEGWDTSEEHGAFKFARAVLARWGRPS